jgi:hypothetical protein
MSANDPRVAQARRALPNHMAIAKTLARYGLHDTSLAGSPDALYERHLTFDNAVGLPAAGARERFEAFASAVRDILAYRWLHKVVSPMFFPDKESALASARALLRAGFSVSKITGPNFEMSHTSLVTFHQARELRRSIRHQPRRPRASNLLAPPH